MADNFQRVFAEARNADVGVARPVTPEELVAIDLYVQTNEENSANDNDNDSEEYLRRYFHSAPLLGKESKRAFMQEVAQEYLAGRTMNTFGQQIVHAETEEDREVKHIGKLVREEVSRTGHAVHDYSKVVHYNTSRMDFIGQEWVEDVAWDFDNDALFRRTVTAAAAAGFFLVLGMGALVTSNLVLLRSSNIGLALAFVGLLAFIALSGVVFINLNAMGRMNSDNIHKVSDAISFAKVEPLHESSRVGTLQRYVEAGASYNTVYDPLLNRLHE